MDQVVARIIRVDDRKAERFAANEPAQALIRDTEEAITCVLVDSSVTGARIALADENTVVPDRLKIYIPERHFIADCTVVWRKGREIGLAFDTSVTLPSCGESGQARC